MTHPYRMADTQPEKPGDHYPTYITYNPPPSLNDLKKVWGSHNVSNVFDQPYRTHPSCARAQHTPGKKTFHLHDARREWEAEERITWGLDQRTPHAPNGYRPAMALETYEFAVAHPNLADFVGLGEYIPDGVYRYVLRVRWDNKERTLRCEKIRHVWDRHIRILLVCK